MRHTENQEAGWGKPPSVWLTVARYGLALFFVATALLWSSLLHPLLSNSFLVLFLVAVMASGWFGRTGPGLFAVLVSSLAVDYFFFPNSLFPNYAASARRRILHAPQNSQFTIQIQTNYKA